MEAAHVQYLFAHTQHRLTGDAAYHGRRVLKTFICLSALLLLSACSGPRGAAEVLDVTGRASIHGNEPFTEMVLQTSDSNWYVLKFEDRAERAAAQDRAPLQMRVTGELFTDQWNGRSFAHLQVRTWEPVGAPSR